MPRTFSKRLVIDASVVFSGGRDDPDFPDPRPRRCRAFLLATLKICHRVVMTPEISKEWRERLSPFARDWLVEMRRKGKEVLVATAINPHIRAQVEQLKLTEKRRQEMIDDLILIEAALATDHIVISLDQTVRKLFAAASDNIRELRNVVWVNPEKEEEQVIAWLGNGARPDPKRRLGFRATGR